MPPDLHKRLETFAVKQDEAIDRGERIVEGFQRAGVEVPGFTAESPTAAWVRSVESCVRMCQDVAH